MIKYLAKNVAFWLGAVFSIVGIFLTSLIWTAISEEIQFSNDGRIIAGTVLAKRVESERIERSTVYSHIVSYEFDPQTMPRQRGENLVDEAVYDTIRIGDPIQVEYVVGSPATHRLVGTMSGWVASGFIGPFAAITGLIGLVALIAAFRRAFRQSRLWNHGTARTARVVEFFCNNPEEEVADRLYQIIYEYRDPGGEMKKGKSQFHHRSWFGRIAGGDTIDIVVDPIRPGVSEWRKEME